MTSVSPPVPPLRPALRVTLHGMSCKHERVKLVQADSEQRGETTALTLHFECTECSVPMVPAKAEIEARGKGFEVRLRPAGLDAATLRCPECGVRLFGRPEASGASFERAPISQVICGMPHLVELADGSTLSVAGGSICLVSENES